MFCNGSIFHHWPKWQIFDEDYLEVDLKYHPLVQA